LPAAPKEIRLHFNENLEPAFSKIELASGKGVAVALPKTDIDKGDRKVMFAAVPPLPPGQYQVRWTAMTFDGHKTKGQFAFRVK
ncbi:MAG: copper resistance protein CopC, partial [Pseudomonadota bacterium]|nr:copper resistance protein CopC [Pseudomonadota bacterium]